MLPLFAACTYPTAPTDSSAGAEETLPSGMAPLAEVTAGECPDLSGPGKLSFTSYELEREFVLRLPSSGTEGAPVLFTWHPLGATAKQWDRYIEAEQFAEDNGVVVVSPQAHDSNPFEWGFLGEDDGAEDLALYDDLRTCLVREAGADPRRFHATGMSAGGLWTSFLSLYRGDTLAGIVPMSGGTGDVVAYRTPAYAFPAMLIYGGEEDTYQSGVSAVDFAATTLAFADELAADGHVVALCDHGGGHTLPADGMGMVRDWLMPLEFGVEGLAAVEGMPEICSVPTAP